MGIFIHANIDITFASLNYVINGSYLHRWHHSTGKGRNRNFVTKFSFWNYLFGITYHPQNLLAVEYGLKTDFPNIISHNLSTCLDP